MNVMLCSTGKPQDFILNSNYIYELKKDGTRALIIVKNKKMKIINRNNRDITYRYPELEILGLTFNEDVVLDAEIVVYNKKTGKSDFNLLQHREHLKDKLKIKLLAKIMPITAVIFDILELNNQDLRNKSLIERKKILREVFKDKNIKRFEIIKTYTDFSEIWDYVIKNDLEGVIAKYKYSIYEDKRSNYWIKIKNFKEEVIEFNKYEENPKGITIENNEGVRVAVLGYQAQAVKELIKTEGKVKANIQYLSKNEKAYRMPSFRGIEK